MKKGVLNKWMLLLMSLVSFLTWPSPGAQVAQVRMYCFSLKFQRGTGPVLYSEDLTTVSSGVNGELAYDFAGSYTHYSYILWNDEITFDIPIPGEIGLDVPMSEDANGDGFPDFFEVARGVATTTTTGVFSLSGFATGTLRATWSRPAGSRIGTCGLEFRSGGQLVAAFTHPFELIEYTGLLTYTPGTEFISGTIELRQTDNESSTLSGPVQIAKWPPDPYNQLDLLPGGWTNETQLALTFSTNSLERDLTLLTNYWGGIFFDDGDPGTGESDYWLWMLSIDDGNDTDGDGIPDFSDDPSPLLPPRQPWLSLTRGETNLWLTVSGDVGHIHHLQDATNADAPHWQTLMSPVLTNDPQSFSLPLPATEARFWRVLAE